MKTISTFLFILLGVIIFHELPLLVVFTPFLLVAFIAAFLLFCALMSVGVDKWLEVQKKCL